MGECSGKSKPEVPRSALISIFGRGVGGVLESQNSKCQDLPKFQYGGGVFGKVKTQRSAQDLPKFQFFWEGMFWKVKTQSAKICLNFNFQVGWCSGTKSKNRGVLENLVKNSWKHMFWKPSLLVHHR